MRNEAIVCYLEDVAHLSDERVSQSRRQAFTFETDDVDQTVEQLKQSPWRLRESDLAGRAHGGKGSSDTGC